MKRYITIGDLRRALERIPAEYDYRPIALDTDGWYQKCEGLEYPVLPDDEGFGTEDYATLTFFFDLSEDGSWDCRGDI